MRRGLSTEGWLGVLWLGFLVVLAFWVPLGAERDAVADAPAVVLALTAEQKLKAENFQLKVQIAQLTATVQDREQRLASMQLSAEQAALIEEFRAVLKPEKDATFDWRSLTFTAPPKDEKK